MKGIVLTVLQSMVEQRFGLGVWDKVVTEQKLESGGSYTAAATYRDEEVYAIVGALSKITGTGIEPLVRSFGKYMLGALSRKYPVFFGGGGLKPFLISVDSIIHAEVRKLYAGAVLPEFVYHDPGPGRLVMEYRSKRRLCALAEGLIEGAAEVFGEAVRIRQSVCMHRGADHCRLELEIGPIERGAAP